MATITMIDLLGTDNIAVSRTDINKNFQTTQNAINTLEGFLDTTPAGGSLTVGSATLSLGANPITQNLMVNQGSGQINGNLSVGLDLTVTGASLFGTSVTVPEKLLVTGANPATAELTVGNAGRVPLTLRDITFIDETISTATAIATVSTETLLGTGVSEVDITGLRTLILDYAALPGAATATSANTIRFIGTPTPGQRLYVKLKEVANAELVDYVWFEQQTVNSNNFNPKYDEYISGGTPGQQTPYNTAAGLTDMAIGFNSALATAIEADHELRRQWAELVYTTAGWEVYNSHPDVLGI